MGSGFSEDPAALFSTDLFASQPVVPQVKLDVAANMNFGSRIFLVPVLLGIVITRFIRCNQGKF